MVPRLTFLLAAFGICLTAEYRPLTEPVPKRDLPPVLFITGHDSICASEKSAELPFAILNFGVFDQVMDRAGRVSLHFNVCSAPNRPPIEEIANVLRAELEGLRYEDGTAVRDIDVVAHSMGGLVLRSYLAGKQVADGVFNPPVELPLRRLVFLGTPHFGTPVAYEYENDRQLREMAPGSKFLFDLARWNGGRDDLRGLEAIALVGTAGINSTFENFTDSVVPLTSGSLDFVQPGRTRVLPACHTAGGLGTILLCKSGALGIARVYDDENPSARAVLSFFNGTSEWQTIGSAPETDRNLTEVAALLVQARNALDAPVPLTDFPEVLKVSAAGIGWTDRASGMYAFGQNGFRVTPGAAAALVTSPGPILRTARVIEGSGVLDGIRLTQASVLILQGNGSIVRAAPVEATPEQIRLVLPDVHGIVTVIVSTSGGVSSLTWLLP